MQHLEPASHINGLGQGAALGQRLAAWHFDAPAYKDFQELRAEVRLAGLQQLLAQHFIALADFDHIAIKQADVLRLIPIGDEGDEIQLGANAAAATADGLLPGDFDLPKIGIGRDALSSAYGIKNCREESCA